MYSHSLTYELEQTLMEYFIITFSLVTILHCSLCVLLREALAVFCSRLSFQGCLFREQSWKIGIIFLCRAESRFVYFSVKQRKHVFLGQSWGRFALSTL